MCGIIGYAGHRPAVPVIVEGLRRLEYRGYDSAGIGFVQGKQLEVIKAEGKLAALEERLSHYPNTVAVNGSSSDVRFLNNVRIKPRYLWFSLKISIVARQRLRILSRSSALNFAKCGLAIK